MQKTDAQALYTAMDWLGERQAEIEKKLAKRHLEDGTLVLYDVSSTYFEGRPATAYLIRDSAFGRGASGSRAHLCCSVPGRFFGDSFCHGRRLPSPGRSERMGLFKDELGAAAAKRLANELCTAWPAFPRRTFLRGIEQALSPLELTQRVAHLAGRLVRTLPARFDAATEVLWRALESQSFDGWLTLPCGVYVADRGIEHPRAALPMLAGLSPRFSSEGPMRPFIVRHPRVTFEYLRRWTTDPDERVRRLVSECTRPRLPWAPVLRSFVLDPSPTLPLLEALYDDPSLYVRRSVANHLNDISKDHPDVALTCARRWQRKSEDAAWVVRHGLRSLVKRGNHQALALLGADGDAEVRLVDLSVDSPSISIGESALFTFTLELVEPAQADTIIDYRVHYVGARGNKAAKVFKLTRRQLVRGERLTISRKHKFEHVSIRRILPGPHTIDLQVNGRVLGAVSVDVRQAADVRQRRASRAVRATPRPAS